MIKIGRDNRMRVVKEVDFGVYLVEDKGDDEREILLPQRYVPEGLQTGDTIDVFIYKDSEGRLIATTEVPLAQVGQFAFLEVVQVNKTGAFLDWGLPTKNLLVPYSEQKAKMRTGGVYPVYVYLDDASQRVVASARLEKFTGNVPADYQPGDKVKALVVGKTERGYRCVVDNLHMGMLYDNELTMAIEPGMELEVRVKYVRPDGKIDLAPAVDAHRRAATLGDRILRYLQERGAEGEKVHDGMSPERVRELFRCSKKDFKKAVGALYKAKKVGITKEDGIFPIN